MFVRYLSLLTAYISSGELSVGEVSNDFVLDPAKIQTSGESYSYHSNTQSEELFSILPRLIDCLGLGPARRQWHWYNLQPRPSMTT
jgi:hypothetical protein